MLTDVALTNLSYIIDIHIMIIDFTELREIVWHMLTSKIIKNITFLFQI